MSRFASSPGRDAGHAVNDLYDHGADLVEAAAALQATAADPAVSRAAPAVMGCMETALHDLAAAAEALERATSAALEHADDTDVRRRVARMRHGFTNLEVALHDAADAAAAARALTARAVNPADPRRR